MARKASNNVYVMVTDEERLKLDALCKHERMSMRELFIAMMDQYAPKGTFENRVTALEARVAKLEGLLVEVGLE